MLLNIYGQYSKFTQKKLKACHKKTILYAGFAKRNTNQCYPALFICVYQQHTFYMQLFFNHPYSHLYHQYQHRQRNKTKYICKEYSLCGKNRVSSVFLGKNCRGSSCRHSVKYSKDLGRYCVAL